MDVVYLTVSPAQYLRIPTSISKGLILAVEDLDGAVLSCTGINAARCFSTLALVL